MPVVSSSPAVTHHLDDKIDDPIRPPPPAVVSVNWANLSQIKCTVVSSDDQDNSQFDELVKTGKLEQTLVNFIPQPGRCDAIPFCACYPRCKLEIDSWV